MKEILTQYAGYNVWAHRQMLDAILSLSGEQQQQQLSSSFPSLYKTLFHMWDAESIWWQRLMLQEHITRPSDTVSLSMYQVSKGLLAQSNQWEQWIQKASEQAIDHVFAYRNIKNEEFAQPLYQVLLHIFNHQTYHRGQLVCMFRQLGIDKIPSTDL